MTKLKVQNFYHYKIKSANIFTVSIVKCKNYYGFPCKSAKIFASKSLKTLLKNASSKFLRSLVRIRSHAVLFSFCIVSIAFL